MNLKGYAFSDGAMFQTTRSASAVTYTALTKAVFGEIWPRCFGLAFWRTCTCGAPAWA